VFFFENGLIDRRRIFFSFSFLLSTFSLLLFPTVSRAETDSTVTPVIRREPIAGLDIGYGWRSNSESGPMLMASYRTEFGSVDLAGILYQRFFNNDTYSLGHFGFGFGFLIYKEVPLGQTMSLHPFVGFDMTVWTTTLGVGFPLGAEVHYPIVSSLDASVSASFEPQFNLNSDKNTRIFDVRLGVRYH
jgi:hypothetical protein